MRRHILVGIGAAFLLLLVYLGIIALAQGWEHALSQSFQLWYWVAALVGGFGVQAGLFSFIWYSQRSRRGAVTASVATSGGVSTGSMVACCAHHLSDVLPLLGLSGMAAFLGSYQLFFIVVGVLSNAVGIAVMLENMQCHGLSQRLADWNWNMRRVRVGTMVLAGATLAAAFLVTTLGTG